MSADWINALIGGIIIGGAASIMLVFNGRVTGISGILSGFFFAVKTDRFWRICFLLGMILGGLVILNLRPQSFSVPITDSNLRLVIAGLLVGFGTVLGSGCTSGHGVCGISRLSRRSILATLTFMFAGILMATAVNLVGGI